MTLLGLDLIGEFSARHGQAAAPLREWKSLMGFSSASHFIELKETFGRADYVKPFTVFDIGGNKFRIAAIVNYATQTVRIHRIMTHEEYSRGKWRGTK